MEPLEELRAIRHDPDELGDCVAAVLLERAERCFLPRRFDEGARLMERALSHFEETQRRRPVSAGDSPWREPQGIARYFNACALAVA